MNLDSDSVVSGVCGWFQRRALLFKVFGLAVLGLLLLIPIGMVRSTLRERQERQCEAVRSITTIWGGSQRVTGPVLVVPYTYKSDALQARLVEGRRVEASGEREARGEAVFLPEQLAVDAQVVPSMRKRGIYETPVYTAKLAISGTFAAPSFEFVTEREVAPRWEQARVCFVISDLRGTQEMLSLDWGGAVATLQLGARLKSIDGAGVHAPVKLKTGEGTAFALKLALNGSEYLHFMPLGRQTEVKLTSSWADPSFGGAYLPVEREVGPEGFKALWKVSHYGRGFPQQWVDGTELQPSPVELENAGFGVSLREPVNAYRTVERAIKYAVLFIALVFTTFFIFEAAAGARVNALGYLLVGGALCLFYLGLLALAEFLVFGVAYALAAFASTLLVTLYCRRLLAGERRAWMVGGMLGGVYAYLYFVLRMEDFSLLAGAGALFALLAAVMWATRGLIAQRGSASGVSENGPEVVSGNGETEVVS